jgi:hypothetical protein
MFHVPVRSSLLLAAVHCRHTDLNFEFKSCCCSSTTTTGTAIACLTASLTPHALLLLLLVLLLLLLLLLLLGLGLLGLQGAQKAAALGCGGELHDCHWHRHPVVPWQGESHARVTKGGDDTELL